MNCHIRKNVLGETWKKHRNGYIMVTSSAIPYSDYPCTSKSGSNVSEKEHWLVTVDMKRSEEAFKK